jgi:ornithine cyclodeaminase/alanine dehydrogenase-like protein (mu-crystallin family)
MILADAATGRPIALIDGESLTAIRTGAASGLATDLLAPEECHTVAIFGAGVQGETQLEAVAAVRRIERAFVVDTSADAARAYSESMGSRLGIPVTATDRKTAVQDADIICAATNSTEPVFEDRYLKPGVHINAIGGFKPHAQEIPPETIARARVIVDSRHSALREAGDLIVPLQQGLIAEDHICAELGELVEGTASLARADGQITVFKSVGHAAQDLVAALTAFHAAKENNFGIEVIL